MRRLHFVSQNDALISSLKPMKSGQESYKTDDLVIALCGKNLHNQCERVSRVSCRLVPVARSSSA